MKRPYYTRKDLITISLAFFYSFVYAFVGMCLDTNSTFVSKKNPIAGFAQALNLGTVESNATGYVFIVLVALYVSVFCAVFLYERRYAIVNHKKTYSGNSREWFPQATSTLNVNYSQDPKWQFVMIGKTLGERVMKEVEMETVKKRN